MTTRPQIARFLAIDAPQKQITTNWLKYIEIKKSSIKPVNSSSKKKTMVRYQIHTAGKRNKGLGNGNGCIIKDPETKATQFNKTGIRDKVQVILKGKSVEK